eukprot:TRINITY_DN70764_c0_g1_i1.p1 TRINITY_DN70764_c0_g1~~TRINITY_DN70764_c0_g1_i1.p1  ORF type:complete len:723 (-),score=68.13 TRINITY_DN70764_c0_g1_i1:117-2285(-)
MSPHWRILNLWTALVIAPCLRCCAGGSEAAQGEADLKPLPSALCDEANCKYVYLGKGIQRVSLDVDMLCDQSGTGPYSMYICNASRAAGCSQICESPLRSSIQSYINAVLAQNPFAQNTSAAESDMSKVPQTDLGLNGSYVFVSQRQALYVALRMLALKIQQPGKPALPSENSSSLSSLEYGLTYGCNWDPPPAGDPAAQAACKLHGPFTGVSAPGLQGNIFGILAWLTALQRESSATAGIREPCYLRQLHNASLWCPHDSVIGAVRGGQDGSAAMAALDTAAFWAKHDGPIEAVGRRPNVCHFESSAWVWRNSRDRRNSERQTSYCKGASHVPGVYGQDVEDFMSIDRPGALAVDIAGAQYGGGRGSASGGTYATQDESTPAFYPESVALGFHSVGRTISTGTNALLFLGIRRYFSGQSGSHGLDEAGLQTPLYCHGNFCGSLEASRLLPQGRILEDSVVTRLGGEATDSTQRLLVRMYRHSLGVITSSCGTCADGNPPTTNMKFRTAGETCLVQWKDGKSGCKEGFGSDWTYWKDVWIWVGALRSDFYPVAAREAFAAVVDSFATGPWGAGVWWGNTLQYFVVKWLATSLLWQDGGGPQLDYYAYGAPGQQGYPVGGFCEQYQAQGLQDVVARLPQIDAAIEARRKNSTLPALMLSDLYTSLQTCSRCTSNCTFPGVGPPPQDVYCISPCTDDFLSCFVSALQNRQNLVLSSMAASSLVV